MKTTTNLIGTLLVCLAMTGPVTATETPESEPDLLSQSPLPVQSNPLPGSGWVIGAGYATWIRDTGVPYQFQAKALINIKLDGSQVVHIIVDSGVIASGDCKFNPEADENNGSHWTGHIRILGEVRDCSGLSQGSQKAEVNNIFNPVKELSAKLSSSGSGSGFGATAWGVGST